MGCCESKELNELPVNFDSTDDLIEAPSLKFGEDENSTDISTLTESSQDSISVGNTERCEGNSILNEPSLIVRTQLTSDFKLLFKEEDSEKNSCIPVNYDFISQTTNTHDFSREEKLLMCLSNASEQPQDVCNIRATFKETETNGNIDTGKGKNISDQGDNIPDLYKGDKSVTCFQNISLQPDWKSNADLLCNKVQTQTSIFTLQLHDVNRALDLLAYPKENTVPSLHSVPESSTNLITTNNVSFPDIISHSIKDDRLLTQGENAIIQPVLESSELVPTRHDVISHSFKDDRLLTQSKNAIIQPVLESSELVPTRHDVISHSFKDDRLLTQSKNTIVQPVLESRATIPSHHDAHTVDVSCTKGKESDCKIRRYSDVLREPSESLQVLTNVPISEICTTSSCQSTEMSYHGKCTREVVKIQKVNSDLTMEASLKPEPVSSPAEASEDLYLGSLAPDCEVSLKEVVSIGNDISDLRKKIVHADKLLYLITAFTFFNWLNPSLNFDAVIDHLSCCTEQMISALHRISGNALSSKVRLFLTQYKTVFCVAGNIISRQTNGEDWLRKSFVATLKDVVEDCIQQGQKTLSELCRTLELLLGSVDVPWFGKMLPETMKTFIMNNVKSVSVINDTVLLAPKINSGVSANQQCVKAIVNYFKGFLETAAIPYNELSMLLSRNNPDLLAALVERNPEAILALLLKDAAFKYENGLVMLKGFTPVLQETTQQQSVSINNSSVKPKTSTCNCCSGIVMCVGKSRATIWCSYSQTCKNVFVIARRSQTKINNSLCDNLLHSLYEGCKVVFTTKKESELGWEIDYAVEVKVVSETECQASCLCGKNKNMDVFLKAVVISNGIPFSNDYTFFWNCKGVVLNISGTKGIVKCMVSDSSDQYFLVFFTNCVWLPGCDIENVSNLEQHLSVGIQVELDIALLNYHNTGYLTWFATCLRIQAEGSLARSNVEWNCSGVVVGIETNRFVISVSNMKKENGFESKYVFAPFRNIYLNDDGFIHTKLTEDMLQLNDNIIFDVDLSSPFIARFLRKCKRPSAVKSIAQEDLSIVVAALKDEMVSNTPVFSNVFEKCSQNGLLFRECQDVQGFLQDAPQRFAVSSLSLSYASTFNGAKDAICQTVSTGPVFSTLVPV